MTHRRVERLGGDVFLGTVGDSALHARGNRFDDRRMEETGLSRSRQFVGELLRLLRGDVESKDLHRDQAVALGLVGAEHRAQRAHADLMKHPKGAELGGCSEGRRVVAGQRLPRVGSKKLITLLGRGVRSRKAAAQP